MELGRRVFMFSLNTNNIVFACSKQGAQKIHVEFKGGIITIDELTNLCDFPLLFAFVLNH